MSNKVGLLILALCAGAVWPAPVHAAPAPAAAHTESAREAFDALVTAVERAGGELGVAVIDVSSHKSVFSHQASRPLNPASNMKLLTAWAALRLLGPHHRYLTGVHGSVENGRVPELTLRGDGDPSLEMRNLWDLCAELERSGVKEIGDVLVDQSRFDGRYLPPAFEQQPDEWAAFRAPVAAVSLAANTVLFEVRPGAAGEAAKVSALPASIVELNGVVRTSAAGTAEAVRLTLRPRAGKLAVEIGGSVPAGSGVVKIWQRVDDPTLLAGHALREICSDVGIAVRGTVKSGAAGKRPLLVAHRSAPLAELLYSLGKESNNFYAEMLFKSLSASDDKAASFERSRELLSSLMREAGFDPSPFRFENGSGLFDANRVSAGALAALLVQAQADPRVGPELIAQLSIGGVDGTLRHRFRDHAKTRAIRAKSGTLASVTSLSGYVLGRARKPTLAFSVLINGARGKTVALRTDIDRFVAALAR